MENIGKIRNSFIIRELYLQTLIYMTNSLKKLSPEETEKLLATLKTRFDKHMNRHALIEWAKVQAKLEAHPDKISSLSEMERTGGEPDVT